MVKTPPKNIQMVDLVTQYQHIKDEVDEAILDIMSKASFIKGPVVKRFEENLATYLGVKHVIGCANGTDALQVAMMALGLEPGDEVIVPSFTYVATAEVIALLRLTPVMIDVDPDTFNITAAQIEPFITDKTKAIVPVHLFGQSSNMEEIMALAQKHKLFIVEDNAQAIGADYTMTNGHTAKTGTIGHIGSTSFYPSKNLGCYGDGGALFTNDDQLAERIRMIANHGQKRRYYHDEVGVNSRLDAMQAAVLDIKLKRLDSYCAARNAVANAYDKAFSEIEAIQTPVRFKNSTHVFHQYTIRIKNGQRDALKEFLQSSGIPSVIFYPVPLYKQGAFSSFYNGKELPNTEKLCQEVLSLPVHTEMDEETLSYITENIKGFFK